MTVTIEITDKSFCPFKRLSLFDPPSGFAGATASFIGRCRRKDLSRSVEALELQHFAGFTERTIQARACEISEERGLIDLMVIHRVGLITPGESIVLVGARASGRDAALSAVEETIDFLKTDAPLWKRQHYRDGVSDWIEPTEKDKQRRQRWT